MSHVISRLQGEIGLAMSADEVFRCAQDPSCLQVWTTAVGLTGKTVRITSVLGSWSMSETGVGNVCHVNAKKDVAYCHVPLDAYKSGSSWLAMGVPVDEPLQEPLPVGVRCHDMGPSSKDAPCHLLSGNEFMAARLENIDTRFEPMEGDGLSSAASPEIISLGWDTGPKPNTITGGSMCLDVGGGAAVNGAPLQMWDCLADSCNQVFGRTNYDVSPGADNQIAFPPLEPGKACVDVPGGNLEAGQTVWLWECDDQDANSVQMWTLENELSTKGDFGPHRLQLTNFPTWCLERPVEENDGDLPYIMPCSDSEFQLWTFHFSHFPDCHSTSLSVQI